MDDLRSVFPSLITRGALLRSDGVAVGLVVGGAPSWELLAPAARAQRGADYQRVLLALDAPLDLYLVDAPPDLSGAIATLHARQAQHDQPLLADTLGAIAEYLTLLAQQSGSRAKQAIWAVSAADDTTLPSVRARDLRSLLQRDHTRVAQRGTAALARAVERARRLADALTTLGGQPASRLLEAEEIARVLYRRADPIRAQRYPLAGTLLDRLRRVVTPENGAALSPPERTV